MESMSPEGKAVTAEEGSGSGQDEPLQLIEFVRGGEEGEGGVGTTTIKLKYDTVDRVFHKIGDLPISIICVCGPSRQGKSFLLGYMIRCLEGLEQEEDDWMGWDEKKKPLKGFKFRNGTSPETQGIWIWSRPFIVKDEEGKEVAVLLVDTQGTNDEFTTSKDMSAIVGLSLLTSSVMVFNFFNNLQEDTLTALSTYIAYGSLALEHGQGSGAPFQKLNFLIRDWNNPGQFTYGDKGGKSFLEEKLKAKDGQPAEARHVRETIRKCFQELDCFLMPAIGEKALYPEFNGSIDELAPKFSKELEKFINSLISTETLTVKEILGNQVTASGLRSCLEGYVDIFNSDEVPSAETMWQATSQMSNNNVIEKAIKKYQDTMKKKLRGNSYLQIEELDSGHSAGKKQALDVFKKAKKFGSPETITEFEEKLEDKIKAEFTEIKKQNEEKRRKFITGATNDAANAFRSQLEDDFPFEAENDSEFYEETKIKRSAGQAQTTIVEDFKEKVSNESEDNLKALLQSIEVVFETILSSIVNKNKANRANAEKAMNSIVEDVAAGHHSKLQEYFSTNKFEDDEASLQSAHEKVKAASIGLYQQRSKPGKKDLHKEYLTKLEAEMDNNFANLKNGHILQIQEFLLSMDKPIQEICEAYEAELQKAATGGDDMDEVELQEIHSRREVIMLEKFQSEINPFPKDNPKSDKLVAKVKAQLHQVYEKIKFEVVESKQRSLESYQKAKEHAMRYYKKEMKDIVESDDLIADDDLEVEHERIQKEAMNEYEDAHKIGVPDNALNIKLELRESIVAEYERIRNDCKLKKELAFSKAATCIRDCEDEYDKLMKDEVDNMRTVEELIEGHEKAKSAAVDQLIRTCPIRDPTLLRKYEEELREKMDEAFEELKDVFELKRTEEETATKGLLTDARQSYHSEMEKHFKNNFFITPTQLQDEFHFQAKTIVMNKCEKKTPLSHFQRADLEKALDALLDIYEKKNDMNLNSGDFSVVPAIGIDLGTTYCCVAVYYKGRVHIIPNQEQGGSKTTPSYVAFEPDGSETYGAPAKDNAYKNPENTIYDAKRIIGRKIADPELQGDMDFWPFVVREDEGVPKVMVNGNLLHPEQISGKLLAQFRVMAEKYLKLEPGTIRNAVITVPAYFNDGQRQATVDAGELAGYENILTILNEPTAAAIAYSLERLDTEAKKVLIYDLGGGTFDVAVLHIKPKEIEVLGVNGDTHLGGEDFDKKMMEHCASCFKTECGIDLFDGKDSSDQHERDEARRRLRRLQTHCEKAKRDLASARTTKVSVDAIINGLDLIVDVTKEKFEELNMAYFEKSIKLVEDTLRDVGLRKEEIEDVVLVGGSSRIPKVQEMLKTFFGGKALNSSIDPDFAVAYGAAVKAAMMNGEQAKGEIDFSQIQDVTPMSLGIEIVTKELSVIIPKNTQVPTKKKEVYFTTKDNQTSIHVQIYQGEDFHMAANNKKLGVFDLNGIPPKAQGVEPVDIWMEINAMGILHVEAVCRSTKGKNSITVQENKQRMSRETIRQIRDQEADPA